MKDKILIAGNGFVGNRLQKELNCEVTEDRINNYDDAEKLLTKFKPDILINCIGFTGKNVDECELRKDKTLFANTFVPIMLAEAAIRANIRFAHISSGCIYQFDYEKDLPIKEDRTPDYFDLFYSRSKIYTDRSLELLTAKYPFLFLRIRVPLDDRPHPKNLLDKLINYKKVIDTPNSVTYIPDFILAVRHLIDIRASGIFNVVNRTALAYPELLDVYKKYVPDFRYEVIQQLKLARTNLILSTDKLEQAGFRVRDIHEVLEECVKNYLNY